MFYVANVITLSIFPELLWKLNLLVCYKLNRFRPPRVNQFAIRALLLGGYSSFIPLDKMFFYGYWKALPSGSLLMLHIALTLFTWCNGLCCNFSNYYLNNYNIILHYVCFYHCLSGWNYIISLTPSYWRKHLTNLPFDLNS